MKVYRTPGSDELGTRWSLTDSKKSQEVVRDWHSGHIGLDGTIKKKGKRHTKLYLRIEDSDVIALSNALFKQYRREQSKLTRDLKKSEKEVETLKEGLLKIWYLITSHSEEAPSKEALIQAVQEIVDHYSTYTKGKPKLGWIKWGSI